MKTMGADEVIATLTDVGAKRIRVTRQGLILCQLSRRAWVDACIAGLSLTSVPGGQYVAYAPEDCGE